MSSPASATAAPSTSRLPPRAPRRPLPEAARRRWRRLFARYPEALARTLEIAERCRFSSTNSPTSIPTRPAIPASPPQQTLEQADLGGRGLALSRGRARTRCVSTARARAAADREARLRALLPDGQCDRPLRPLAQDILCQGRGSAANSAVCYVLGITSIDPERNDLLFERFVSEERREPPDIDVDFEHERRERSSSGFTRPTAATARPCARP